MADVSADTDMAAAREASDVANEIRAYAAARLRSKYLWLKTEALEKLLDQNASNIESTLAQQQPVMDASRSRMGFMKLSAELRNRIYELILVYPPGPDWRIHIHEVRYDTAFLRLNRRIRHEAMPMYYSQNVFCTEVESPWDDECEDDARKMEVWLKSLGSERRAMIKEIVFKVLDNDEPGHFPLERFAFRQADDDENALQAFGFRYTSGEEVETPLRVNRCGVDAAKWKIVIAHHEEPGWYDDSSESQVSLDEEDENGRDDGEEAEDSDEADDAEVSGGEEESDS